MRNAGKLQQAIEAPRWATLSLLALPLLHAIYPADLMLESPIPETVKTDLEIATTKSP